MRAKVVLPVLMLPVLLIAIAIVLDHRSRNTADALPPMARIASVSGYGPPAPNSLILAPPASLAPEAQPARSASVDDAARDDHAPRVAERIAELNRLAMTSDPRSLDPILLELSSREPAIRMAAISATIDFGSRDAIPALQNALGWTEDLKEKVEIQSAIDFLQLPSALAQDHTDETETEKK